MYIKKPIMVTIAARIANTIKNVANPLRVFTPLLE
jgi:p-aminobenzoyl-glutamate transporter AbgT